MKDWYRKHLGIDAGEYGWMFHWRDAENPERKGETVWSLFKSDTTYFNPSTSSFMVNYRVDNMDALLSALREEGIEVHGSEDHEYGRFAWISDPEGNKIELWEPPVEVPSDPLKTD